jgi:succinyl-diaminopimelate desuccinylase
MSCCAADAQLMIDPVEFARALIRCPSVTPADAGALDALAAALAPLGFACQRLRFSAPGTPDIDNLFARWGDGGPHFCFAGHTDVVPVGDRAGWTVDPFAAEIIDGQLYGRGAADMKGSIAAFVAAAESFIAKKPRGSISLLITGDEEGPAINGTAKVLEWMEQRGERPDAVVVGEPTSETALGDMVKIGRRGSMNVTLTALGAQGHVAYPHLADNPNHRLVRMLAALIDETLDTGTDWFQASSLQATTIDVGNATTNVIPARATARVNIRFNDQHSSAALRAWMTERLKPHEGHYTMDVQVSGEAFFTAPGPLSALVARAIGQVRGVEPKLSTTGGTSDARFIRRLAPVVEFGLPSRTMHKVDERAAVADIRDLARIYAGVLDGFFATPASAA